MLVMDGAEAFCLQGNNKRAVLLLHGYTGSPAEMRPLGDYLHGLGYTVLCPLLPGHGTSAEDLERTTADAWLKKARRACRRLAAEYDRVYVAGLSMGGLLAMKLAAEERVCRAAFLAAPIYVCDKRAPLLPFLRHFIRWLPKRKRDYKDMEKYCQAYDKMPTRPLTSLFALMKECRQSVVPQITIPALVVQSTAEHTVKPKSAQYIFDHLGTAPQEKKLLWLHHSGHIVTLDCEHEQVFAAVGDFFAADNK